MSCGQDCWFKRVRACGVLLCRIVRVLLEQVVSSTVERCVDPQLMEQSVSLCI